MKIVTACQEGNNRSVNLAHRLRYWKHEVIPVGLLSTSRETREMLWKWADIIILIIKDRQHWIPEEYQSKIRIFDVPHDIYPRPFNPELDKKVKQYLEDNKSWLKP